MDSCVLGHRSQWLACAGSHSHDGIKGGVSGDAVF